MFRSGGWAEGNVVSWSDQKTVLKSVNNNICVIQKTAEDVIAYTIIEAEEMQAQEHDSVEIEQQQEMFSADIEGEVGQLEQEFQAAKESESENPKRLSRMAELKIKLADAEKRMLSRKLKSPPPLPSSQNTEYKNRYQNPFIKIKE